MVVQLHKIGSNEFKFVLTPQAAQELELSDGCAVEIRPVVGEAAPRFQYVPVDEVMKAHREMEPEYAPAYRELAK
jgi:hypothetical protein